LDSSKCRSWAFLCRFLSLQYLVATLASRGTRVKHVIRVLGAFTSDSRESTQCIFIVAFIGILFRQVQRLHVSRSCFKVINDSLHVKQMVVLFHNIVMANDLLNPEVFAREEFLIVIFGFLFVLFIFNRIRGFHSNSARLAGRGAIVVHHFSLSLTPSLDSIDCAHSVNIVARFSILVGHVLLSLCKLLSHSRCISSFSNRCRIHDLDSSKCRSWAFLCRFLSLQYLVATLASRGTRVKHVIRVLGAFTSDSRESA